jgi:hypothetical protein
LLADFGSAPSILTTGSYLMHTLRPRRSRRLFRYDAVPRRPEGETTITYRDVEDDLFTGIGRLVAAVYTLQRLYLYSSGPKSFIHGFQRNMVTLKLGNSNTPSPFHSDSLIPTFSVPAMFVTSHESPAMEYTWTLPEDGLVPVTSTF